MQSPEVKTLPQDTLFCFLDLARVCGADCIAFQLNTPASDPPWRRCALLCSVQEFASSSALLSRLLTPQPPVPAPPPPPFPSHFLGGR